MIAHMMAAIMALQSTPQQFDLICVGTMLTVTTQAAPRSVDHTIRYRVDLDRGVWCVDDCSTVKPFADVSAMWLTFDRALDGRGHHDHGVQRMTGQYVSRVSDDVQTVMVNATCEPAPFTLIPAARF